MIAVSRVSFFQFHQNSQLQLDRGLVGQLTTPSLEAVAGSMHAPTFEARLFPNHLIEHYVNLIND